MGDSAEVLARSSGQIPVALLNRSWILAEEYSFKVAHAAGDPVRIAAVATLAPAHQSSICLYLDKRPRSPSSIAMKRLNSTDAHGAPPGVVDAGRGSVKILPRRS